MGGFYNPKTNTEPALGPDLLPQTEGCTHISDMPAAAREWFSRPARPNHQWQLSESGPWPEEVLIVRSVDEAFTDALLVINNWADQQLQSVYASYPRREIDSWPVQQVEAAALQQDSAAAAPFLRRVAASRGMDLRELAHRVDRKSRQYAELSGDVFGRRQAAEDALTSVSDNPDLTDDEKRQKMQEIVKQFTSETE